MIEITLEQYMMGRDKKYSSELLPEYIANAEKLLVVVNKCLNKIANDAPYITFEIHPVNKSLVSSGWRPAAVNAKTPGSSVKSKHMTCNAIDIYDPDGDIDDFLVTNESILKEFGLYLEHPSATKGWCHLQQIPPNSKKVIFYP